MRRRVYKKRSTRRTTSRRRTKRRGLTRSPGKCGYRL